MSKLIKVFLFAFLFAPFTSVLDDAGQVTKDAVLGDWDAATKRFLQKIAPAPIFTKWILNLWGDKDFITPVGPTDVGGKIRKTFKKGDVQIFCTEEIKISQFCFWY